MKIKQFIKENRYGYLYSCLVGVIGYPLLYMIQEKTMPTLSNFLLGILVWSVGIFILMMIFGLLLMGGKE